MQARQGARRTWSKVPIQKWQWRWRRARRRTAPRVSAVPGDRRLRKINGDLDTANLELDRSHKAEAETRAANDALTARVTALEGKIADIEKAQAAAAAAAAAAPAADGSTGATGGSMGAAPTGDSTAEFHSAMALMTNGDYAGASQAFAAFVAKWPGAPETPEAHYRLAETYYVRDDQPNSAALETAASLKDWPHAKWAPDATVKLALAFSNLGHDKDACATLGGFPIAATPRTPPLGEIAARRVAEDQGQVRALGPMHFPCTN